MARIRLIKEGLYELDTMVRGKRVRRRIRADEETARDLVRIAQKAKTVENLHRLERFLLDKPKSV